ncbi:hypothetical protein [Cupriavidus oxalaticus]|uniref:hypothetical protein n=1 Tax=Cupriavidus oxalaticus TaxID=96344 RepID=UPI004034253A
MGIVSQEFRPAARRAFFVTDRAAADREKTRKRRQLNAGAGWRPISPARARVFRKVLNSDLKKLQLSLMCGAHTLPVRQFPPPAETLPVSVRPFKSAVFAALFFARGTGPLFPARRPHIVIPHAKACISLSGVCQRLFGRSSTIGANDKDDLYDL